MEDIYKHIALTLRSLRRERGWSLDKTAEETGVSKAMLGQIEREESSPTIATVWKIASGFEISFSSLLEELQTNLEQPLHRQGQQHDLHPVDENIIVRSLFPYDPKLNCEIFQIELLPYSEHLSLPHKPGVIEHVIVITGKMELLVDGEWQQLIKGEGLRFNANQPHGYRNSKKNRAIFHNIIHYKQVVSHS